MMRNRVSAGDPMTSNTPQRVPHKIVVPKGAPRWRPYPWSRYSKDDQPRTAPLPRCPSAKCRRAKACLDAHKGLYCQRTHFTFDEGMIRTPKSEAEVYIQSRRPPPKGASLDIKLDFIREVRELWNDDNREQMKLWRAGAFGDVYGKYRTGGVLKTPPPRVYEEQ
jgi:hypothetical protein